MMGHTTTRTLERYVSNTHAHHLKAVNAIADRVHKAAIKTPQRQVRDKMYCQMYCRMFLNKKRLATLKSQVFVK